jgi:hypothetical protein
MARPSVDGLEQRMRGELDVARIDISEPSGQRVAQRFAVDRIPAFLLLDSRGEILYRQVGGRPDGDAIAAHVHSARR